MAINEAPIFSTFFAVSISAGRGSSPFPRIYAVRSGMAGLLSITILKCSWSFLAGVLFTIFKNRSAVASGPMPPKIPTVFPLAIENAPYIIVILLAYTYPARIEVRFPAW
jgi:hypothetical protein